jgi:hypothetical protein
LERVGGPLCDERIGIGDHGEGSRRAGAGGEFTEMRPCLQLADGDGFAMSARQLRAERPLDQKVNLHGGG